METWRTLYTEEMDAENEKKGREGVTKARVVALWSSRSVRHKGLDPMLLSFLLTLGP